MISRTMVGVGALAVLCALAIGMPLSGSAQSPSANAALVGQIQAQLKTATFHSGELAQKVTAVAGVQLHMHHVLNCLEGQGGKDYLASAGYPCQGQGNGIIPDLQVAVMHNVPGASSALQEVQTCQMLALQAAASTDLNQSQPYALVIARHLQTASQDLAAQ